MRACSNVSGEISQYSANEFARCNRHCAAFMTVCIPMWPQSNYYSLHLCSPRHHTTKPCVVSPRETLLSKLAGSVRLLVLTPNSTQIFLHIFNILRQTEREILVDGKIVQWNKKLDFSVYCYSPLARCLDKTFNSVACSRMRWLTTALNSNSLWTHEHKQQSAWITFPLLFSFTTNWFAIICV